MKLTDEQKRWMCQEYEDFQFQGDLVDLTLSVDAPIRGLDDEDMPKPNLVIEVTRIVVDAAASAWLVIEGPQADHHYTQEQMALLTKAVEEKYDNDCAAWAEQHDEMLRDR